MTDVLPTDLAAAEPSVLKREAEARDERMSPLFRRWPNLSRSEMAELRRLYSERLRLARYVGARRRRRRVTRALGTTVASDRSGR
jgi:hypothetical protein